jgi:hypothetical protein
MGRTKPQPQPEAVILPPELDDDDEHGGGGIPDEDGWIHLSGKEPQREDEKPKQRPAQRRSRGDGGSPPR